jgi:hypothetical protein
MLGDISYVFLWMAAIELLNSQVSLLPEYTSPFLHCHNKILYSESFIKKRVLFSSQFWGLKVHDWAASLTQPLTKAL